jgi:C1A family cysteine protease
LYQGDIFDAPRCHIFDEEGKLKAIDNDDINHFALLVGYGSNDGNDYWILQNSWGKAWGDKGFFF